MVIGHLTNDLFGCNFCENKNSKQESFVTSPLRFLEKKKFQK
jgi:hypothetical protein